MPSSHPIPSIAALALSLYASDRRVERLPVVTEYDPRDTVLIVPMRDRYAYDRASGADVAPTYRELTIGGDL